MITCDIGEIMADCGALQKEMADEQQFRWLDPHKDVVQLALGEHVPNGIVFKNYIQAECDVCLERIPQLDGHFVHPVRVQSGAYHTPQEAGSSCDFRPSLGRSTSRKISAPPKFAWHHQPQTLSHAPKHPER